MAKAFFPKVKDIAHMGVTTAPDGATVGEAVALMEAHNLSDVVFGRGDGYAIFTVRDLLVFRQHKRSMDTPLRELSVPGLDYVDEEENVLDLLSSFDMSGSRYLGVRKDDGKLTGVVSYSDVLASVDPVLMMERRTLSDLLGKRRVDMVSGSEKTEDVLARLNDAEDAVLIAEDGRLAGIVTTRDAIRLISESADTLAPIRRYMSTPVRTINQHATIKAAIEYLQGNKFKRAIVAGDDGRVIGAVTQRELIDITYGGWAELIKLHANELGELVYLLESENRQLQRETLTDSLTGVGNRRRINQVIEAEIGRYYRHGMEPFSILLIDIDFFKQINDTHGHLAGDRVLVNLCKTISGMLRVSDEVARWGGEEFVAMLPATGREHAAALAERMRAEIAGERHDGIGVTVSIGVAEYRRGESLEELMARADHALYSSKQAGRNRVAAA